MKLNSNEKRSQKIELTFQVLEDRNSLPMSFDDIELSACSSSSSSSSSQEGDVWDTGCSCSCN